MVLARAWEEKARRKRMRKCIEEKNQQETCRFG